MPRSKNFFEGDFECMTKNKKPVTREYKKRTKEPRNKFKSDKENKTIITENNKISAKEYSNFCQDTNKKSSDKKKKMIDT